MVQIPGCESVGLCVVVLHGDGQQVCCGSHRLEAKGRPWSQFRHFSAAPFLSFPLPFWLAGISAPQGSGLWGGTVHAMNAK